jgi:predicted nucleic acid-binding protein
LNRLIVLDTGPLGMLSNPAATPLNKTAKAWLENLLEQNIVVALPEIADYEVRRELLLHSKTASLAKLDELVDNLDFIPFTRQATLLAAKFWAEARRSGNPTAAPQALDCDVLLAAQAIGAPHLLELGENLEVIVATTNPGHLSRYVKAVEWQNIS